ncbi:uncharacterized protein METZ01_LOCUS116099 [marine metagenome]|uniref:Uncharacterized protein n=1 Tax=marine metagenome TaxID=408172 RepID=A0A381XET0_9ZZZZ
MILGVFSHLMAPKSSGSRDMIPVAALTASAEAGLRRHQHFEQDRAYQ